MMIFHNTVVVVDYYNSSREITFLRGCFIFKCLSAIILSSSFLVSFSLYTLIINISSSLKYYL